MDEHHGMKDKRRKDLVCFEVSVFQNFDGGSR